MTNPEPERSPESRRAAPAVTVGSGSPQRADHVAEYDRLGRRSSGRPANPSGTRGGVVPLEHTGSTHPGIAAKRYRLTSGGRGSADEAEYCPARGRGTACTIREPAWHEHRLFKGPETEVNLHVFSRGSVELDRMVGFRDWLRTHPEDLQLYERTKRELAARTWRHVQHYADAKTAVVEEIIARAGLPPGTP